MPLTVNSNIPSLRAQDALEPAGKRVGRALDRLSSGKRINEAADDAAGLAIADRLGRDEAVAAQVLRNASDGVSALRIADAALSQVNDVTGRIAELAAQAASGLVSDEQRATIQQEISQLRAEVDRIGQSTSFNGQPLFDQPVTVHVGLDGEPGSDVAVGGGGPVSSAALGLDGIDVTTQAGAQAALAAVDGAGDAVNQRRAAIGANESQLTSVIDSLRVTREQLAGAESRIRDADVAAESADLVAGRVRQQFGVAVAAQANLSSRVALRLLG